MTLDQWVQLARRINGVLIDPGLTAAVITSSTDSLENWRKLSTTSDHRPVVLVGAMRSVGALGYEGLNLLDAFAGGGGRLAPQGVLVV